MVAGGYNIDAACKYMLGRLGRNTVAVGGVFTVCYHQSDIVPALEIGQYSAQMLAADPADNVSDKQYFHCFFPFRQVICFALQNTYHINLKS